MTLIDWPHRTLETLEYVPTRIEGCACGGVIVARGNPTNAVKAHQKTPRHAEWRAKNVDCFLDSEA